MTIELNQEYKDKNGNICVVKSYFENDGKQIVLVKFGEKHPYDELGALSETFDERFKVGHTIFEKSEFAKKFVPNRRRIWTDDELFIAYAYAKYGTRPFGDLKASWVVGLFYPRITKNSLFMQVAQFRNILGIEGYQLNYNGDKKLRLVRSWGNLTFTQVIRKINTILKEWQQ